MNPNLQLSSLLWDYPVAVGIGDPRQQYFRMLAIGLGTKDKPSWTLPEHTYYSDGPDVGRIIARSKRISTPPARVERSKSSPASASCAATRRRCARRGETLKTSTAAGYWLYELADLKNKTPIDFEALIDPPAKYVDALSAMNREVRQHP